MAILPGDLRKRAEETQCDIKEVLAVLKRQEQLLARIVRALEGSH